MSDKDSMKQRIVSLINLDVKKAKMMDEEQLMKVISEIDQIRMDSVREGRFLDAENAKQKLKALRDVHNKLKKSDVKNRQNVEKSKLEEDFQSEFKAFTAHWDERIGNYEKECQNMEKELLANNRQALEEYKNYLEETQPLKPKDSTKILDLKVQLDQLVKQEEYKDAHYTQQRIFDLEKTETDKYQMERNKKIEALLDQKAVTQQNEYLALRKRIINGLDELELQRKAESDRLLLKYDNIKKNIEKAQNMESYIVEKSMKSATIQQSIRNYFSTPLNPESQGQTA